MRTPERRRRLSRVSNHRRGPRSDPSQCEGAYAELLGELIPAIERRRREAQGRLDALDRRRASMSRIERAAANEALCTEAVGIRNELARLKLVVSLTTKLLEPLASRSATTTARVNDGARQNGPVADLCGGEIGLPTDADRCAATSK
jgi:hypothetical protein